MAEKSTGKKAEAPSGTGQNRTMLILGAVALAVLVAVGIYYARGGFGTSGEGGGQGQDRSRRDRAAGAGALPDMTLGSENAPNTIVEYASMTCPHCAHFQTDVFPQVKEKYIPTPARCATCSANSRSTASRSRHRCSRAAPATAILDARRAVPDAEELGRSRRRRQGEARPGRQAGRHFASGIRQCLADKELFNKIVLIRQKGNEDFQVEYPPRPFSSTASG